MKVAFYTLGCKVNQYETDLMMKSFTDYGYDIVDFEEKADIYVINSCSVTNLSTRKTRQYLSRAKKQGGIVFRLPGTLSSPRETQTPSAPISIISILFGVLILGIFIPLMTPSLPEEYTDTLFK